MPYRFVTPKWIIGLTVFVAFWALGSLFAIEQLGMTVLVVMFSALIFVFGYFILEILLRLVDQKRTAVMDYEELQSLVGFYATLKPRLPLFDLRRYALAPDSANLYMHYLALHKPEIIVECGSGVSTVISGTMIERNGKGRVIALEDDEHWAGHTRDILEAQGVAGEIEVRYAPLKDIDVAGETRSWYDQSQLDDIDKIDFLLVDGPIDRDDRGNRYAALELLKDKLSDKAVIFCDDTFRPNWKRLVHKWAEENKFNIYTPYPNDHETLILTRM